MPASALDQQVFSGVKAMLDEYLLVKDDDTYLIAYTPDSREPAAWVALSLRHRGFTPSIVPMLPLKDATFAERFEAVLPDPARLPGRLVVITLERDTMSHFDVFESVLKRYGAERTMIARVISASTEFFTKAMNVPPSELSALNATLLDRLKPASKVRVTTEGGTDVTVELDAEKYQWISNRGFWRQGGYTILPAGEVATYPTNANGVLVADGAFNANIITSLDVRLAQRPVRVTIEGGKAVELTCPDPELQEMFRLCLASPNGSNVGEFGLGTNHGIDEFIPANSHINERRCGLHLGFGQHNQSLGRVPYIADIHLDLITQGALVWVDDDPQPIDLRRLVPSGAPHPMDVLDEDITGDCCGMAYGELQDLAACPAPGSMIRIPR